MSVAPLARGISHHGHIAPAAASSPSPRSRRGRRAADSLAVVLDLKLTDSQDLSLLARLRELLSPVQIVVMTAHGTPEIVTSAIERGAHCVLHKPFGLTELTDAVGEASRLYASGVHPAPLQEGSR